MRGENTFTCVGVIWVMSSEATLFKIVVFPELSKPSNNIRSSFMGSAFNLRSKLRRPCGKNRPKFHWHHWSQPVDCTPSNLYRRRSTSVQTSFVCTNYLTPWFVGVSRSNEFCAFLGLECRGVQITQRDQSKHWHGIQFPTGFSHKQGRLDCISVLAVHSCFSSWTDFLGKFRMMIMAACDHHYRHRSRSAEARSTWRCYQPKVELDLYTKDTGNRVTRFFFAKLSTPTEILKTACQIDCGAHKVP